MTKTRTVLIALLALLASVPLFAQGSQIGTILGAVTDEQGGALPGVTVTLTAKTGTRTTVTSTTGEYRFPALSPGSYEVRAEMTGFKPKKAENVIVSIGSQSRIDFSLAVGSLSETVEVLGEAPLVDVSSSSANNSLSQDILYNMPIDRRSFNVYNFAPGIKNSSAFGSGSSTSNALLLDGVDTRDPDGGTDWSFFNYNIIEEVQIQGIGANAEYGSFTGAVVNTVSKSGGNKYAGLFDLNYTKGSLASDNITPAIVDPTLNENGASIGNPSLGAASATKKYLDVTAQISGPIQKDRLFFFASVQRFEKEEDPAGPRTSRKELSHRANVKFNFNPSANDSFVVAGQFDDYSITGRCDLLAGDLSCTDAVTHTEDAPEFIWNTQWRHLFSSKTFLEAKYVGWWGYYYLDPAVNASGHADADGSYSVSSGIYQWYDRGRNQVNASISHFAEGFGKHDLKFGVEIERSKARNRYGYINNIFYYDYDKAPYLAYSYSYDVDVRNHRDSAFAQDSWKPTDRLTVNGGLRFDWVRGISPALDQKVYDTKSIAPRIGLAYSLTGDNKTVLRGFYGQYYEGASAEHYIKGVPGVGDFILYDNSTGTPGAEVDRSVTPVFKIDPNIKQPKVEEFTLGIERALSNDFRLQVTGILRHTKNYNDAVFPSARWEPITVTNQLTGQPETVYRWANRDVSDQDGLVRNIDGFQYLDVNGNVIGTARAFRDYKGLMIVLTKRFTNRWQTQISYVYSKTDGTIDNTSSATYGNSFRWASPTTALINTDGRSTYDQRHELKAYATYQVPVVEIAVNAYFHILSGLRYTPYQQLSSSTLNFPQSSRGRRLLLDTRGAYGVDTASILDLRLEKIFKVGGGSDRLSVYVDIKNVFNSSAVDDAQSRYPGISIGGVPDPVAFGAPASVVDPRQLTMGARWAF